MDGRQPPPPRRASALLVAVSTLEALSLAAIVTNRLTVQDPVVTSTGGPLHGVLYLAAIVFSLLAPIPRRAAWLALVPGVGGLLAIAAAARTARRAPEPPEGDDQDDDQGDDQGGDQGDDAASPEVSPSAAVRVRGLVVEHRGGRLVGPLAFEVPRGRVTGLIGPNGAGKTTALRALVGLVTASRGHLQLAGTAGPAADRARFAGALAGVGSLVDGPALMPSLSGADTLHALARLSRLPDRAVAESLERVGLADRAGDRVQTYSLGMRQRLGLAAALMGDPWLLVLDEPANGLDPQGSAALRALLTAEAARGTTVLVSSHLLADVEEVCDHLVVLSAGRVVFQGPPHALVEGRAATVTVRPDAASDLLPLRERLREAGWAADVDPSRRALRVPAQPHESTRIGTTATGAGFALAELRVDAPSLQAAFFALTGAPGTSAGSRLRQPEAVR